MLPPRSSWQKQPLTHNLSAHQARQGIPKQVHVSFRDGQLIMSGFGHWTAYWRDPYYLLLTIPWAGFLGIMTLGYIVINTCFALAFLVGGDCIANATPGSFADAFFFSVQTLGAIGYGVMSPATRYADTLVAIEGLTSILSIALMTGLAFARFAQPTARVMFSRVAVIAAYNGVPTLMFRAANQRRNLILEAQTRVYLLRDEVNQEGKAMRRFYELNLARQVTPAFSLPWTIMHPIDEQSPLFNLSVADLENVNAMLMVSVTGIDETVAQMIYARHVYSTRELVWHHQFVDLVQPLANGEHYVDYTHFHDVTVLENR
ncbi:MAG: ion channel [Cyanobacteria bacterium P01_H01_bin.121]